jgi:hypothetical protein
MFDTPLVQITLGLMLLFVLFSLLVSAILEMGVALCKSRGAALWDSIEMLLGGGAQAKSARGRIYAHPLVRTLVPPSSWSWKKPGPGRRTGPSYISSQTFSTALLDVLREPHKVLGDLERELRRTLVDLGSGDVAAAGRAAEKLASLAPQLPADSPLTREVQPRLLALQRSLSTAGATAAHVQDITAAIDAFPDYWRAALSENARAISTDLEGAITTLAAKTAGGIDDTRKAIEHWFDESMATVSGWYKRWTMAVQLGIGIVLAFALNIDTVHVIRELSTNEPLRRSIAAQADAYARTGVLEQRAITADTSRSPVKVSVRSTSVDAFTLGLPGEAAGRPIALKVTGGPESVLECNDQATLDTEAKAPTQALVTCLVAAGQITKRTKVSLEASYTVPPSETATTATLDVFLLPSPEVQYEQIEKALQATAVPIGWKNGTLYPEQVETRMSLVLCGIGWLFTALAGSLGAPFWFDLLKRVANLRASGPNPTEQPLRKV